MIMIVGISASGKTYTIQRLQEQFPNTHHIRASSILRAASRPLRPITEKDVFENQRVLIENLPRPLSLTGTVLFDGHAMIETTSGPMLLPDWVFDSLTPSSIVCIVDSPAIISERRHARGWSTTASEVEALQELEEAHARTQAKRMEIPYLKALAGDVAAVSQLLQ
ncbi:ATP-binding protein [Microvirga terrae]|uniref:ATP-binding protein n=1 Tax=Microvirga terrae TaxID=2740529 RepID=A0ABY5RP30_9HYPH|nr:ATP-binding protein [Microvirga terrae]UVF19001.1 ATP-binding protein [Microvirga terrae]